MPMSFQLKFSPQDVVEADWVNAQFAKSAGLDAHTCKVVWRKKSLDARGRAPFFLITADVYAQGELVEAENGYRLKSVEKASPVHIIGAGPAGLFCALELIELGLKPIVL
jgi:heterodisulfide reductase subunit A-like polyferredoxin